MPPTVDLLTTQLAKGGIWSLGGQTAILIATLIATPFVIRGLGPEAYGTLILLNLLVEYLGFSDLGMGAASTRFAGDAYGKQDHASEASVIWTCLLLTLLPTLIVSATVVVFADSIVRAFLSLPADIQTTAALGLRIAAVGLVFRNIAAVLNTTHLVRLRLDIFTLINSGCIALQVCLVAIAVGMGWGLIGAITVAGAISICLAIFNGVASRAFLPQLRSALFQPNLARTVFRFGRAIMVSSLIATVLTHAEKFLVVRFSSVEALAYYSVAFSLASLLGPATGTLKQGLLPAFAQLQATSDKQTLNTLYNRALRGTLLWLLPIAVFICIIGEPFLTIWAGADFGQKSTLPLYVMVVGFAINVMTHVPDAFLKGIDKAGLIARFHAAELVPYIAGASVLTYLFGATGAALAWTLRAAADALLQFVFANRIGGVAFCPIQTHRRAYAFAASVVTFPLLLIPFAGYTFMPRMTVTVICLLLHGWIVWFRVLSAEERSWLTGFITAQIRSVVRVHA